MHKHSWGKGEIRKAGVMVTYDFNMKFFHTNGSKTKIKLQVNCLSLLMEIYTSALLLKHHFHIHTYMSMQRLYEIPFYT